MGREGVIGFDEALARVRQAARPLGSEPVALDLADGRVLAEPVRARADSPPDDSSAMDGYAVRDADLCAFPCRLAVIGESFAGAGFTGTIQAGEAVRIFTGAPLPAGADRIVIQENVARDGACATIERHPGPALHVRPRGSDFAAGDLLVAPGRLLDPRALVAAAAADRAEIVVWRRPRLIVLASGDELAEPGRAAESPGTIPESVSFGVAALARAWGAEIVARRRLSDSLAPMQEAGAAALEAADLVLVTGGASVGEKDFARAMFEPAGLEPIFSKVAIKPGKPVWLGRARGRLVMGLPGNPTSALVTARLLLAPLLAGLTGRDPNEALRWRTLPLADDAPAVGDRETFARARARGGAAELLASQDSSAQRLLAAADLLVRRRPGAPAARAGDMVEVLDF